MIPWQRKFQAGHRPEGREVRRRAIGSPSRTGKSYLVADIAKDYLLGDRHDSECLLVASEFKQAKVILRYLFGMLRADGHDLDDRKRWTIRDSMNSGDDPGPAYGRSRCSRAMSRQAERTVRGASSASVCSMNRREHGPGVTG